MAHKGWLLLPALGLAALLVAALAVGGGAAAATPPPPMPEASAAPAEPHSVGVEELCACPSWVSPKVCELQVRCRRAWLADWCGCVEAARAGGRRRHHLPQQLCPAPFLPLALAGSNV